MVTSVNAVDWIIQSIRLLEAPSRSSTVHVIKLLSQVVKAQITSVLDDS